MRKALTCFVFFAMPASVNAGDLTLTTDSRKQSIFDIQSNIQYGKLTLNLPGTGKGRDAYFIELLETALISAGYKPAFTFEGSLNYKREIKYLVEGKIAITWRLATDQRDETLHKINVGLTNGLIAKRIFLIPKGQQYIFNEINSIDDLINSGLTGVFDENWFDTEVWKKNRLPFITTTGDLAKVYRMLADNSRGIDYFSRGVIEISDEAEQYPGLEIERHLLFVYPQDFYFYLGNISDKHKQIIEDALLSAQKHGLVTKLIEKHWGHLSYELNLNSRIAINLALP